MITIAQLTKSYGGRTVLDIPSLSLAEGGRYALLGANGSGKSTLLKILAGQLSPDTGSVDFGGVLPRDVGYLPQKPYAFDQSVLQNVLLAAGKGPAGRARAVAALTRVGMEPLMHARGSRLSGGETQRMALARVLAREWRVLLLDEPTSAMDLAAGDAAENALREYAAETGCTLLFSTHAPGQARRLATHALVLDRGRLAEAGAAKQVLDAPVSDGARALLARWRG